MLLYSGEIFSHLQQQHVLLFKSLEIIECIKMCTSFGKNMIITKEKKTRHLVDPTLCLAVHYSETITQQMLRMTNFYS